MFQRVKETPCQIPTNRQKVSLTKFSIALTGEKTLPLNAISKLMNLTVAQKMDFLGKLTNISITFLNLLFSRILRADFEMLAVQT